MNLIKRILDYSYHARDVRALDPETGKPVPRAGDPPIWIRAGAMMMNASWAKRNLLKYIYTITGPLSAWLAAHGGGEHTAAIVAGAIAVVTFLFDRLTSWLNEQATMKIPPRVGAPTAEQERESIEAYAQMQPPQALTSNSGPSFTRSAMFESVLMQNQTNDEEALAALRASMAPTQRITIPTQAELDATRAKIHGCTVQVYDPETKESRVETFTDTPSLPAKTAASLFVFAAREKGLRATHL